MRWLGYVHTPIAEHHRWSSHSRRSISTGKGPFSRTTRLMLHEMRWRKPPRQHALSIVAWTLSIVMHLIFLVAMALVRPEAPYSPPAEGQENAIQVRFIDASPPPPPPPPVAPRKHEVKKHVVRRRPVTPSQAPNLAPVAVPPPSRPKIGVQLARTKPDVSEKPQPLPKVQPVEQPPASPPAPVAPAIAVPPPPKVVLEPSKMALPPPKVALDQQAPVQSPSKLDQPIVIDRPKLEQGAPKLEVTSERAAPLAVQPVDVPQPELPQSQPQIDVGTQAPKQNIEAAPAQKLQVDTTAATQPLPMVQVPQPSSDAQAIPAAPVQAPQVKIDLSAPEKPDIDALPDDAVAQTPIETVPDVEVPAPAQMPARASTAVAPAHPSTVPAQVKPDTSSWAQTSDRFGKKPVDQPGQGTADKRQAGKGTPGGVPDYIQRQPQGNSDVMTRRFHGLDYKPTIFEKYWAPANQDALTALLQRVVDALSFKKTFDLGRGVRIHCGGWLLGFGCGGDPPSGPSSKSGDRRLNMAPAQPLVPGMASSAAPPPAPVALPKSSTQSVECETARVSGGILPPGCEAPRGAQKKDWN